MLHDKIVVSTKQSHKTTGLDILVYTLLDVWNEESNHFQSQLAFTP